MAGADRRLWLRLLVLGLAMLAAVAPPAAAVELAGDQALYTARVPVDPNDPAAREGAYRVALERILARLTGSRDGLDAAQVDAWFPNPARYVLQYQPGEENTLWVTLDGAAIENVLRQHRQTVWGGNRPLTMIWLAVDWGQGEREIIPAEEPERRPAESRSIDRNRLLKERIVEAAAERGLPVAFPILDAEEREVVNFSDVWGGFNDGVLQASRRYGASSVLIGRIRADVAERNRWSYFYSDERREWTGQPEEAVNLLADMLSDRLAIAGDAELATIDLTVSGIDSVDAYGSVQSYMQNLDVVEAVSIHSVSGDSIRYRLTAHGGPQRLRQALEANRRLEPVDVLAGTGAGGGLHYRWLPGQTLPNN